MPREVSEWRGDDRSPRRAWGLLAGATLAVTAAWVVAATGSAWVELPRALLVAAGLIAAGAAVHARLRGKGIGPEESLASAGFLLLAALPVLIARQATRDIDWLQMCLGVLAAVAFAGAVLVALPPVGRRVAVSFLVLFHFGGILTAVTTVPPPGGAAPWLPMVAWAYVYRPYLGFLYLNNAYHFYSPEPGPPQLLWFRVQYADKTYRWVRLPVRSESPLPLHYQRLLALTESTNHLLPNPPTDEQLHRRRLAGNLHSIPFHPTLLPNQQYREPDEYSKQMLSAYARYAARHFKHLEDPNVPVTAVKLYRVTHGIVAAPQLASEISPLDPTLYLPFYQGEFDPDGRLKDPQDPFLYWLLPIYYDESRPGPDVRFRVPGQPGDKLVNCLSIHAGDAGPDLTGGDNLP